MSDELLRIDKLLKLSENNPSQAEADAALKKAGQLMRSYIDDPSNVYASQKKIRTELEEREARLDKVCSACGETKPQHHDKCPSQALHKKLSIGMVTTCFSCAGMSLIMLLLCLWLLFERIFG